MPLSLELKPLRHKNSYGLSTFNDGARREYHFSKVDFPTLEECVVRRCERSQIMHKNLTEIPENLMRNLTFQSFFDAKKKKRDRRRRTTSGMGYGDGEHNPETSKKHFIPTDIKCFPSLPFLLNHQKKHARQINRSKTTQSPSQHALMKCERIEEYSTSVPVNSLLTLGPSPSFSPRPLPSVPHTTSIEDTEANPCCFITGIPEETQDSERGDAEAEEGEGEGFETVAYSSLGEVEREQGFDDSTVWKVNRMLLSLVHGRRDKIEREAKSSNSETLHSVEFANLMLRLKSKLESENSSFNSLSDQILARVNNSKETRTVLVPKGSRYSTPVRYQTSEGRGERGEGDNALPLVRVADIQRKIKDLEDNFDEIRKRHVVTPRSKMASVLVKRIEYTVNQMDEIFDASFTDASEAAKKRRTSAIKIQTWIRGWMQRRRYKNLMFALSRVRRRENSVFINFFNIWRNETGREEECIKNYHQKLNNKTIKTFFAQWKIRCLSLYHFEPIKRRVHQIIHEREMSMKKRIFDVLRRNRLTMGVSLGGSHFVSSANVRSCIDNYLMEKNFDVKRNYDRVGKKAREQAARELLASQGQIFDAYDTKHAAYYTAFFCPSLFVHFNLADDYLMHPKNKIASTFRQEWLLSAPRKTREFMREQCASVIRKRAHQNLVLKYFDAWRQQQQNHQKHENMSNREILMNAFSVWKRRTSNFDIAHSWRQQKNIKLMKMAFNSIKYFAHQKKKVMYHCIYFWKTHQTFISRQYFDQWKTYITYQKQNRQKIYFLSRVQSYRILRQAFQNWKHSLEYAEEES